MPRKIDKKLLECSWLHAHEEDMPGKLVFRPKTYALPPARGRTGYEFQPGGRMVKLGSGPTDRHTSLQGTWTVDSRGRLTISIPGAPAEVLEIDELDSDRLVLKQ